MSTPPTRTTGSQPPPVINTFTSGIQIVKTATTPRTIDEALTIGGSTYTRAQRAALTADNKAKYVKAATEPSFTKFSIIDFNKSQSDKYLEESFSFMTQVDTLRRHLHLYGLHDVFHLEMSVIDSTNTKTLDLLTEFSSVTISQVQAWSRYLYLHADEITIENLTLSQRLLLAGCDDNLYNKVNSELSVMPSEAQSGPTTFMLIARNIVVTTEKTNRAFTYHLQRLRLNQIEHEDVDRFSAIFKGAAKRLEAANQLPIDCKMLVYDALRTSSVYNFRQVLEIKYITKSPDMADYEKILDTAQLTYHELLAENQWLPRKKQGSSFVANQASQKGSHDTGKHNANSDASVDRRVPKKGESHTRTNRSGDQEHWCGKCPNGGRWGNHLSEDHDQWRKDFKKKMKDKKEQARKNKSGNNSGKTAIPESAGSTTAPLRPALRTSFAADAEHF